MNIKTTTVLTTFDGDNYTRVKGTATVPLTLGFAIASMLTRNSTSKDPLRDTVLATDFYKNESIDINEADVLYVTEIIKLSTEYFPGVKGFIFSEFEKAKNQPTEEEKTAE